MTDRESIAAAHERLLYAYVFDEVAAGFSAYREDGRRRRFRSIYARVLNERVARLYPLFSRMHGPIGVDELLELRVELRAGDHLPDDADYYRAIGERLVADGPKAEFLRELLRVERAKLLAGRGPIPALEVLLADAERLDAATLREAGERGGTWDGAALHYVELRTSLKESLASVRRSVGLPEWTVRTPSARASVIYRAPGSGRVEHWCFATREQLAADLRRRAARP